MTIKVKGFVTHCLGNFFHCCFCFVPNTCSSGSLWEIRAPVKSTLLIVNTPQGKPCKYCIGTSKLPAWFTSSGPKGLRFFLKLVYYCRLQEHTQSPNQRFLSANMQRDAAWNYMEENCLIYLRRLHPCKTPVKIHTT